MNKTLFDVPETVRPIRWNEKARTVLTDEREIIRWIMLLHNDSQRFDLDPTYSTGRFWRGLPKPRLRFDIAPQVPGVVCADARRLPLADNSVQSVMFDPPFVVAPNPKPGIIRDRFSCYRNVPELWDFYRDALAEFWRIIAPGGLVTVKCQDIVSGGINYMTHAATIAMAQEIGFYCQDLFILHRQNVLWSPNMANQQHARKTHSYFLIFRKTSASRFQAARILRKLTLRGSDLLRSEQAGAENQSECVASRASS